MRFNFFILYSIAFIFLNFACTKEEDNRFSSNFNKYSSGSGDFLYSFNTLSFNKSIKVYYYLPLQITSNTPVLFVFHGNSRNAVTYRNDLVEKAKSKNVIVIVPEFSEANFPGSQQYILGHVYQNPEDPNPLELIEESSWTFSVIEPLFEFVQTSLELNTSQYSIIGHSAGAQFAHRLMLFKDNLHLHKAVFSAAGWYTLPSPTTPFPYGQKNSILENKNFLSFYQAQVIVQVGALDNNPNDASLRRNAIADQQGINRLDRAQYFFNFCKQQAQQSLLPFNWTFKLRPNASHEHQSAINDAFNFIY